MTHDRVMRFVPVFDSHDQAARFAVAEALAWLGTAELPPASTPETLE